jgi:hypothetical protein
MSFVPQEVPHAVHEAQAKLPGHGDVLPLTQLPTPSQELPAYV